tara:strand:- start:172 stop:537 length:366 start_codon:yes stop_codon:yes gene_type:complete
MKVRDLGRAILDFELSSIGEFFIRCINKLIVILYKFLKLYTRFFPLVILAVLIGFGLENYSRFYTVAAVESWFDGGIQISGDFYLNFFVIVNIIGFSIFWLIAKVLTRKLEPVIQRINQKE